MFRQPGARHGQKDPHFCRSRKMVAEDGIEPPTRGFSIPALPTELLGQIVRQPPLRFPEKDLHFCRSSNMVAEDGIEPPTRGFSTLLYQLSYSATCFVAARSLPRTRILRRSAAYGKHFGKTFTLPSAQVQVLDPPSRHGGQGPAGRFTRRRGVVIVTCGRNQRAMLIGKAARARPARGDGHAGRWNAVFVAAMGDAAA